VTEAPDATVIHEPSFGAFVKRRVPSNEILRGASVCERRARDRRKISNIIDQEVKMPAKSQVQQKAAGAALSAKRGDQKISDLRGASKSMAKSMSEDELAEMASIKRKGKPVRARKD
jgi:hypothetical protein